MITCEICGTQAEQHDHWRHLMVARVAALEDVVTREPATDEQPASAGVAPKRCLTLMRGLPCGRPFKDGKCTIGHLDPPAEQPTGCPGCACCNDDACPTRHADCHHAEQPSRQETGGDCGVTGCHACTAMRDRAKAKAAESPAPAVGTLSERIRANIPAANGAVLGMKVTGEVLAEMADEVAALEASLAQAERERDWRGRQVEQMAEHVAKMRMELDEAVERLKCEACTDAKSILCATCIDREERDATARERERCLAWAQADVDNGEIATAIDNGAPAPKCDPDQPREVAPDRTPCSELCGSKFIVEARREVITGDRKSVHERDGHCYSTIACLTARKCVNK